MSTELARPVAPALSPARMGRALIVADALQQEADQRKLLGEYVRHHMIEGTDFGVIPGTVNRTLYKPGAEKLTQLYRCVPRFSIEEKIESWDTGLFYYRFACQIVSQADNSVVAEGVGSCHTYEGRYRWRTAGRVCPECGKEAIIKGKAEYGGGWLCFKKKDGCGAKFADDDADITDQPSGRTQNPDILDQVNTVLKMAKKRALVDAAIALARCSDIFTQDMEDAAADEPAAPPARAEKPRAEVKRTPKLTAGEAAKRIAAAPTVDALKTLWAEIKADYALYGEDTVEVLVAAKETRKHALTPAAPAPEGEDRADPTTPSATTAPAESVEAGAKSAASSAPPASAATPSAADPAPKPMPAAERRTQAPLTVGKDLADLIDLMVNKLKLNWSLIRDRVEGPGREIADKLKLDLPINARVRDLPADKALALHEELKARFAKKQEKSEAAARNKARKVLDEQEAGAA